MPIDEATRFAKASGSLSVEHPADVPLRDERDRHLELQPIAAIELLHGLANRAFWKMS